MLKCAFAGHRIVLENGVVNGIRERLRELLQEDQDFLFYTGAMGEFDSLCISAVHDAKTQFPEKKIRLVLVLPYMTNRINQEKAFYQEVYDKICLPFLCDNVHPKAAIHLRNRWMADRADVLITYVRRDFGGAYAMRRYGEKQGKRILDVCSR